MESYLYHVGSNGFNKEGFEEFCESIGVVLTQTYGETTQYGQTLVYNLRIPDDKFGMVANFINDAPNRLFFSKNI